MRLTLLDANLWLLPFPFSRGRKKRLEEFIKFAKKMAPDIMTLQEVWSNKDMNKIKDSFQDYHAISHKEGKYNKTGLLTLTKIKPESKVVREYPKKGFSFVEKIAAKGFIKITLPSKYKKISILNTHLYNPVSTKDKFITKSELEMLEFLSHKGEWVIAGDLNMTRAEFEKLNKKRLKGEEKDYEKTFSTKNHYIEKSFFKSSFSGKLDYVLFRTKNKKIKSLSHRIIKHPEISDHYAIFSEISL